MLNREPQNFEGWNRFAQSFLKRTEYITSIFDIHYSIFDIRFFKVPLSIKLTAFQASGGPET